MGARGRPLIRWCLVLALPAIAWSPSVADSAEPEVGGMITEIHVGQGRVEVGSAGGERHRPATPLLTLRDGDVVATTGDAWVVVVLSGGAGRSGWPSPPPRSWSRRRRPRGAGSTRG